MSTKRHVKTTLRKIAKSVLFTNVTRQGLRSLSEKINPHTQRSLSAPQRKAAYRKLISDSLPVGHYYARIRIANWRNVIGTDFELLHAGKTVYGNRIESPAKGFALEYSNIIVSTDDPSAFAMEPDLPYTIQFSKGQFETAQQIAYDERFSVKRSKSGLYYSIRGNITDPQKIIFTFPGFGPSTTRIPYSVSALQNLNDTDLQNTCLVAFQDRYGVSGTYMMFDNQGNILLDRVTDEVKDLLNKYNLSAKNALFFGASKGGSTAILVAASFPKSHLVVAVPQINLPYYTQRAFFKSNIGLLPYDSPRLDVRSALLKIIKDGSTVDYFYSWNDELSNDSTVEKLSLSSNLSRYKIRGKHGEVTRTVLPTILFLIRRFLTDKVEIDLVDEIASQEITKVDDQTRLQISFRSIPKLPKNSNYYLCLINKFGGKQYYSLSNHHFPFVKYMSQEEFIYSYSNCEYSEGTIIGVSADGTVLYCTINMDDFDLENQSLQLSTEKNFPISVIIPGARQQVEIIAGENTGIFECFTNKTYAQSSKQKVAIFTDRQQYLDQFESISTDFVVYVKTGEIFVLLALLQHLKLLSKANSILLYSNDEQLSQKLLDETCFLPPEFTWYKEGIDIYSTESLRNYPVNDNDVNSKPLLNRSNV